MFLYRYRLRGNLSLYRYIIGDPLPQIVIAVHVCNAASYTHHMKNRHGRFLTHVLAKKRFTINHVRLKLVASIVLRCDPIPIR